MIKQASLATIALAESRLVSWSAPPVLGAHSGARCPGVRVQRPLSDRVA